MLKLANGWTPRLTAMILPFFVIGCVSAANAPAICDGTATARTEHAAALADDGGDRSVVTGAHLIRLIDAGCADQ